MTNDQSLQVNKTTRLDRQRENRRKEQEREEDEDQNSNLHRHRHSRLPLRCIAFDNRNPGWLTYFRVRNKREIDGGRSCTN